MPDQKNNMCLIFMGTSNFSADILESLIRSSYEIISVYTQPDKKVGRKQALEKTPVKLLAEKNNIPVYEPSKLDKPAIETLREQNPDMIILVAYGKILPKSVLEIPRLGAINIHPSLLPKYRGPSPIQNALLNGEKITGTTVMLMDSGIDTGDILAQEEISIQPDETYPELEKKLSKFSSELLLETLPKWIDGNIRPKKQDDSQASYCRLVRKEDGKINWDDSAEKIYDKYRAFFGWPGIFTFWNGRRLKLNKIRSVKENFEDFEAGYILRIDGTIYVKTGAGAIALEEIQIEGKPKINAIDFVNGYPDFIGSVLK